MSPEDFAVIDILRCELSLRALQAADLPPFLGSTLRGAFGHALKQAVCVMEHRNCERCMVADRCIYPYLFETPVPPDIPQLRGQKHAPHPFILTPDLEASPGAPLGAHASSVQPPPSAHESRVQPVETEQQVTTHSLADGKTVRLVRSPLPAQPARRHLTKGDELTFGLVLIGRAIEYLPYVVFAVSEMARHGLGADRAPFELAEVATIDESGAKQSIYSGDTGRITVPPSARKSLGDLIRLRLDQLTSSADFRADRLRVRFLTPARIRVEGNLQVGMTFELFVRNLLRRVSMLAAVHGSGRLELDYRGLIERARRVKTRDSALRWYDWERYSNRQQTKMALGGFVDEIEYEGEILEEFLSLMGAGEILHVGGGTSFGLGKYQILSRNESL